MDHPSQPTPPDQTTLSHDLHYQIIHELRLALPPPITDSPEDRVRRDNALIARVAALLPANADEVILAAQYIAASAHALDCLRLARQSPNDVAQVLKCTAQSAGMMRQARGARAQLLRLQVARGKRRSDNATRDEAGSQRPGPEPTDKSPPLSAAEHYALAQPSRAALIRSLGRLPKKFADDTLSPALIHDIINGTSPILQALAKKPAHRLAAAA
jgi:hypothetical protein